MRIKHNQTKPEWLVGQGENSVGTGAFLVPDVTRSEGLPLKMEWQNGLSYVECVRRAEFAAAFKWIPQAIANSTDFGTVNCKPELCLGYCSETLCWCVGGACKSMT
jgi:hypothetical protein